VDSAILASYNRPQDFNSHIEELTKKLSKRIGLLRHISKYLKRRHQREVYYNTVLKPIFLYGASTWSFTSKENLNSILKLQKRAARIITSADKRASSFHLFIKLNWIPFHQNVFINRCALIHRRTQNKTPEYLYSKIILKSDTHKRRNRFSHLNLPKIQKRNRRWSHIYCEIYQRMEQSTY